MSDARSRDPREYEARDPGDQWPRVYDARDRERNDPREALMRDLDLPRGDQRELVVDRERVYELDGEDSRTLAVVGAFRVVPEHDLDLPHDTLENLRNQRLVELVDLGEGDRGLTLTTEARDLLNSHSMERDREASQGFYAGVSRSREMDHDSNLYATFRQEEARLSVRFRSDPLQIHRTEPHRHPRVRPDHPHSRPRVERSVRAENRGVIRRGRGSVAGRQVIPKAERAASGEGSARLDWVYCVHTMSQTCPRCRLISPDGASRCDCGYEFATGKMAASYLHEHLTAKHGGASNLYQAEARRHLASGIAALAFAVLLSVMIYLGSGRIGIAWLPMLGAVVWLLRARRFHRQSKAALEAERGSERR
jgi:hypothetical protein